MGIIINYGLLSLDKSQLYLRVVRRGIKREEVYHRCVMCIFLKLCIPPLRGRGISSLAGKKSREEKKLAWNRGGKNSEEKSDFAPFISCCQEGAEIGSKMFQQSYINR